MYDDDPWETWLFWHDLDVASRLISERQAGMRTALDQLTELLDNPPPKKANLSHTGLWVWNTGEGVRA